MASLNDFGVCLEVGKKGETAVKNTLTARKWNVEDVSKQTEYQQKDIDLIVWQTENDSRTIEIKYDSRIADTGNMFVEYCSNSRTERAGWLSYCKAEYIFYVDARNNLSYCFLLEDLKDYIEINKNKLRQGTTRDGYKEVYGYLVSINDFRKFLVLYKDSYFQELDLIEVA